MLTTSHTGEAQTGTPETAFLLARDHLGAMPVPRHPAVEGAGAALVFGAGFMLIGGWARGLVVGLVAGLVVFGLRLYWRDRERPNLRLPVKLALLPLPFVAMVLVAVLT